MNKMIRKLLGAVMALILTVVMVVTVSYAWFTLSDAPVVEGIQVTIGGGNTILIAPDQSQTVDGTTYHYPGRFDKNLIFSQYSQYDYLKSVAGLTPVSTADGEHWYMAEYYDYNDIEVINGEAVVGQKKPIAEFPCDTALTYANLTDEQSALVEKGSYVYLDFWVVSPSADFTLRVSTGDADKGSGSYLLEMKQPVRGTDGTYTLVETAGHAAASARVGFLVCPDRVSETNLNLYRNSAFYDSSYGVLKGMYQQPGEDTLYTSGYRFTIYEPNGDLHPLGEAGAYNVTKPIGYQGGKVIFADIRDRLAVQLTNVWKSEGNDGYITLDEAFRAWGFGKANLDSMTSEEIMQEFYGEYMQNALLPYVRMGRFVKHSSVLYHFAYETTTNSVSAEQMSDSVFMAGATEDTYIVHLEKNVPQRIRMFIWLEGQDVDCIDMSRVLNIALSVELAGGSQ